VRAQAGNSTTVGLLQLVASIVAVLLWDRIGHTAVLTPSVAKACATTAG
jgi:hypothetical protein